MDSKNLKKKKTKKNTKQKKTHTHKRFKMWYQNHKIVEGVSKKCRGFKMCLNLSNQVKIYNYILSLLCMNFIDITD